MKNIAIFGSSRSGKSTLSRMIARKYTNYHIIVGDDIRWAFQEVLPDNHINSKGGSGMTDDFPNFLSFLFYKSIKRNKDIFNYIVETCDMTPSKAFKLFNSDDTIIIFLGTPNLTIEKHFEEIRKYESDRDWTYGRSDDGLWKHCVQWINKSKEYEIECKRLGIWFVDTSFNRDKVLDDTLCKIEEILLEND